MLSLVHSAVLLNGYPLKTQQPCYSFLRLCSLVELRIGRRYVIR